MVQCVECHCSREVLVHSRLSVILSVRSGVYIENSHGSHGIPVGMGIANLVSQ